jgi:hypothetical protein
MLMGPNTQKMVILGKKVLTQPIASTSLSSASLPRDLHDGTMCTTRCRVSISFQARLGNYSATYFQVKQGARSRCMSHTILPLSILWRNRQSEALLVLRPKPRNCHSDFEAQITKLELPVLRPKPENQEPPVLRPN